VALSKEEVHKIKKIIENTKNVKGYHKLKTRQSGNMKFVEVDLEFDDKMSLQEAHNITRDISKKIKKIDVLFEWDIYIHMDTEDDSK
jgi:ferrous-iron efflux pump FieF